MKLAKFNLDVTGAVISGRRVSGFLSRFVIDVSIKTGGYNSSLDSSSYSSASWTNDKFWSYMLYSGTDVSIFSKKCGSCSFFFKNYFTRLFLMILSRYGSTIYWSILSAS